MSTKYLFFAAVLISSSLSYALEIDSLDTSALWTVNPSSGTEATLLSTAGKTGKALQIDYNLKIATNPVIDLYREDFGLLDVSQNDTADALRFRFKGSGNDNNLEVKIYDQDGRYFLKTFYGITGSPEWTEMFVSLAEGNNPLLPPTFTDLYTAVRAGSIPASDLTAERGKIDLKKISKISFAVSRDTTTLNADLLMRGEGGQGAVVIDQLELYQQTAAPNTLLVDNFDDLEKRNSLGGLTGGMSPDLDGDEKGEFDPLVGFSGADAQQGRRGLFITYDIPVGQWAGYYSLMTALGDYGQRDISSYSNLEFWVKGKDGGENFKENFKVEFLDNIEFIDSNGKKAKNTQKFPVGNFLPGGVTTSYQKVTVPLSIVTTVDLTNIRGLNIVIDEAPFAGTIYLDEMKLTKNGASSEGVVAVLDSMDDPPATSSWKKFANDEDKGYVTAGLDGVDDARQGRALQLSYNFARIPGSWAVIERNWGLNLSKDQFFTFQIKGTGAGNNLLFKVVDKNNTVYQRKFYKITDTAGEWQTITVPYRELSFFQKGVFSNDDPAVNLDLTAIKGFHWAITKAEGGSGSLMIDQLSTASSIAQEKIQSGGSLIQQVSVTNNPFSPNGDGYKDTAIFNYRLGESAQVKFYLYNLRGDRLKTLEDLDKTAGSYTVSWDGRDDDGDKVANGLYLYHMESDNHSGTKEKFTQVISVMK
ncbi:MAG: carbohydrate binding domain-containing protein [Elusimicrobiota bacterium]